MMKNSIPPLPAPADRITARRAAEIVGCSRQHLYNLMKTAEIENWTLRTGKRVTTEEAVGAYLARRDQAVAYQAAVA